MSRRQVRELDALLIATGSQIVQFSRERAEREYRAALALAEAGAEIRVEVGSAIPAGQRKAVDGTVEGVAKSAD